MAMTLRHCTLLSSRSAISMTTSVKTMGALYLLMLMGFSTKIGCYAFHLTTLFSASSRASTPWRLRASFDDLSAEDPSAEKDDSRPLLLPGSSTTPSPLTGSLSSASFDPFDGTLPLQNAKKTGKENRAPVSKKQEIAFVASRKFELQYTCKVCETRNHHRVSRAAYNNGVVIAQCKGCKSQHLIADHLEFTKLWQKGKTGTIEEFFAQQGPVEDHVNRVSKEVFDLEKTLNQDTSSGSILDEDGNPQLE